MYFRYRGTKYYVATTKDEYIKDFKAIKLPPNTANETLFVVVDDWLGTRPQRLKVVPEVEVFLQAFPCLVSLPGYQLCAPVKWSTLIQKILREKKALHTCTVSFSRDALCHTDPAFRQELVSKAVLEEEHWGKLAVEDYKVVGVEAPDILIVTFSLVLRKHL
jgi:hypothetical protein